MIKCQYCGQEIPDDSKFCTNCGAPVEQAVAAEPVHEELPVEMYNHEPEPEPVQPPAQQYGQEPPVFEPAVESYQQPVQPIPTGGLIAWAVFVILGCWIPGVVALYYIFKINKAQSVSEQEQLLSNAKKVLIIGTVLSALNLLRMIFGLS